MSWFQPQKKEFFKKSYIQTILSLFGFFDLYEKKIIHFISHQWKVIIWKHYWQR